MFAGWLSLDCGFALAADLLSGPVSGPQARVVVVHDPAATQAFCARGEVVRAMVDRAMRHLTGRPTLEEAWRSVLFTNTVALTNEVVGIKVYSAPGSLSGTRPSVVAAVVEGLLAAGMPARHIVVWDKKTANLRLAGYFDFVDRYGIRVEGAEQAGFDTNSLYEAPLLGDLVWGDVEFGQKGPSIGRKSFVTKLASREITRLINITPLLSHNAAGVSGNLFSLASGSVDNFARFEADSKRLGTAVPEIFALPALSDRVVLNITDALICQYEGAERSLLHYSATLNELRFSRDPVALDVLALQDLEHQRRISEAPSVRLNLELYANAALLELGVNDLKRIQVERVK